jgi:phage FluMu protein Com
MGISISRPTSQLHETAMAGDNDQIFKIRCGHCDATMKCVGTVPRLGGLPELRTYRCPHCSQVKTVMADEADVA